MRFNAKFTAVTAASVFAVSLLAGHSAYAETPQQARPESTTSASTDTKKVQDTPKPVTVMVQPGDSLSAIADAHQTTWVRIFDANDAVADPNIINPDETLTIPTADQQLPDRYGEFVAAHPAVTTPPVASAATASASAGSTSTTSSAPAAARATVSAGNSYVWGNCTWYVKNMRPEIGSFWGNAGYNWLGEAAAAGFSTGSAPRAGAIAVEGGHVAYVQSTNGSSVTVSEMNYAGGLGQVHVRTVSAGEFQYIY